MPSPETLRIVSYVFAAARIAIGLGPFVVPDALGKLLGVTAEQDTPLGRVFARMFGVRDAGLGLLVLWATTQDLATLRLSFVFNALMDLGDAVGCAIPLVKRQGIDRPAASCLAMALGGGTGWVILFAITR